MRTTVPFVPYAAPPVSVRERKVEVEKRRRVTTTSASAPRVTATLAALRAAGARLHDRDPAPFTPEQLVAEFQAHDPAATKLVVRRALHCELRRPDAVLVQTGPGRLEVRPPAVAAQVRPTAGDRQSPELVLEAVGDLAEATAGGPTVTEVWEHLAAQGRYYEISGIHRCLRRALASGQVTLSETRPRRFVLAAPDGTA